MGTMPTARLAARRTARREDLGLGAHEYARLRVLTTPHKIQDFVNAIPINREPDGETVQSVRAVLRHRRAHCIEGALVAACALWIHGEPPLLMHLDCAAPDSPHVVALFRRTRHWGAISKSNHTVLRFRDAVYRTLRELAMSYLHEYCDPRGHKSLRSYSRAFDLRRVDPRLWVTGDGACWETHDRLAASRHDSLLSARQARELRRRDTLERQAAKIEEFPR